MSKYLYEPYDIAILLMSADFTRSREIYIRNLIWNDANIPIKYRNDEKRFIKDIDRCLEQIVNVDFSDEAESINSVLADLDSKFSIETEINEEFTIDSFFRIIKLKLTYCEDTPYVKIKLRTLLRKFDYQRRHPVFISKLKKSMKSLGIETYIKGLELCDIGEINLDDMVMMRLK